MDYLYDVFISYRRVGMIHTFNEQYFYPLLDGYLQLYGRRVYSDFKTKEGEAWPAAIADALLRSRIMVALVAPVYFDSAWCLAEWQTMLARQAQILKVQPQAGPLVLPIRLVPEWKDAPNDFRILKPFDFAHCFSTAPGFRETRKFLALEEATIKVGLLVYEILV
jgi:hypothetical protein